MIEESYYFINGIETILVDQKLENHLLSRTFNTKYSLQSNPDENLIVDVTKGVCGLVSNRVGCYLEGEVAKPIKLKLTADLSRGKEVHIAAHSQGAIIIHNVLGEIYRSSEPSWWKRHARQVNIRYFGSSIRDWPPGISAIGYEQKGDEVARIIGCFSRCVTWTKAKFGREYKRARLITIEGGDHDFRSYLKNQPHFYVQDFLLRNKGELDGKKLAIEVTSSIKSSRRPYGNETYSEIIKFCVKVGGREFCRQIRADLRSEAGGYFVGDIQVSRSLYQTIELSK